MAVPNRLAEVRRSAGLSQSALARELVVDTNTIGRWERGERAISDEMKLWFAERFGVTVAYLMDWPERAPSEPKAAA